MTVGVIKRFSYVSITFSIRWGCSEWQPQHISYDQDVNEIILCCRIVYGLLLHICENIKMYKYFRDYAFILCNSHYSRIFELIEVLSVYGKCVVLFVDLQITAILPVCYHHVHEFALGLLLICLYYLYTQWVPPTTIRWEGK